MMSKELRYYYRNKEKILKERRRHYRKHRKQVIDRVKKHQKEQPKVNRKAVSKYYQKNKKAINEKSRCQSMAQRHVPLDDKCIFCGETEGLEHGHLDYEDNGLNVVTTCHTCNVWMGK